MEQVADVFLETVNFKYEDRVSSDEKLSLLEFYPRIMKRLMKTNFAID